MSYSYCRNIGSVIASHNRRIIQPTSNNHESNCSSNRAECPLHNKCLTANIVYKAVVSALSSVNSFKDHFTSATKNTEQH